MIDRSKSVPASMFEEKYQASEDPWNFRGSQYEQQKYQATLDILPRDRYQSALEIGCSIGIFTRMLAARCDSLLAVDVSDLALQRARQHNVVLPHVRFSNISIPARFPDERFDLMVLSEVGYYWSMADLEHARERMVAGLQTGGQIILVHWTGPIDDAPLTGDEVHEQFLAIPERLIHVAQRRESSYRVDVLELA